ncbi:MAG: hypothetical protein D6704_07310 [Nitrospirae bacterium]|nr:MAG: hypothetical protein D6704_07310 [Nitrospirota bacterium]
MKFMLSALWLFEQTLLHVAASVCSLGHAAGRRRALGLILVGWGFTVGMTHLAHAEDDRDRTAIQAVIEYAQAIAAADSIEIGRHDFTCLLKMVQAQPMRHPAPFASPTDPLYSWCWQRVDRAHAQMIEQQDRGLDELWPGHGKLVNFADFKRFLIDETGTRQLAPSFFVMNYLSAVGSSPGFTLTVLETGPLPHASFQLTPDGPVVAVPTRLVRTKISYPNPLTAPVANAPGEKDWAVPYKKPVRPVKSVIVRWVVLLDLAALGFPADVAVLNIPLDGPMGTTIPFVVEAGGYEPRSTEFWKPSDDPVALDIGVQKSLGLSDHRERVRMLNRVLAIDPHHLQALQALTNELYDGLLNYAERLHGIGLSNSEVAQRFNELYWTIQAQTDRMDIALDMEMGGKAEPTPADYLYRMIPAMETLADLEPGDFDNRLRLCLAYQWTNDQLAAIMAPQQLLTDVPEDQTRLRARILLTLAWARIGKVAWNRHFDDPDIIRSYEEADQAARLTDDPLDKFTAAYAKAYSLAFRPQRDNHAMFTLLSEARQWYTQLPGVTPKSWDYLLQNATLKGLVDTDPAFQSLLASASPGAFQQK